MRERGPTPEEILKPPTGKEEMRGGIKHLEKHFEIEQKKPKEILLNIKKAIEREKEIQEEQSEDKEPHLIWWTRLMASDPYYLKERTKLEKTFKKIGVDIRPSSKQKGEFIEDRDHPLYQSFLEGQRWIKENFPSGEREELINIETRKTREPGVTFAKTERWFITEREGKKTLVTDYGLYTNLETKKESK